MSDEMQEVVILAKVADPEERKGGMRLNSAMKAEVVDKAVDHAFATRVKKLENDSLAVGKEVYYAKFPQAVVRTVLKLGEPWHRPLGLEQTGTKADTKYINAYVGGECHPLLIPTSLPLPNGYTLTLKGEQKALQNKLHELTDAKKELAVDKQKVIATLTAMLTRITTYPSLEKNWPAGKRFYQHLPQKYPFRHQVPAVLIEELNAALGI